jgi:hypothetical protein
MFSCGDVLTISGLRRFVPDDSFFNPTLHIGLPIWHPFRIFVAHPAEGFLKKNHHDVFSQTSRCLQQIITMSL